MKYDVINVIDIEATCWDKSEKSGDISEIIEIGITELDVVSHKIISSESIYVTPKHSKISNFCYKLTGISQEFLDSNALPFWKACNILMKEYNSKSKVWASYGEYDLRMFDEQCYRENVNYPFGGKHINVKTLFALKYAFEKEVGMIDALKILKFPLEGRHHCGCDDSYNIAKILGEILWNKKYDNP